MDFLERNVHAHPLLHLRLYQVVYFDAVLTPAWAGK